MNDAMISVPIAPLFARPGAGEYADEALCGMTCKVLGEEAGFLRVRMFYGYEGFTAKENVRVNARETALWESERTNITLRPFLDILSRPNVASLPLATLPCCSYVKVLASLPNGWVEAKLCDGTRGYTRASSLGELPHRCDDEEGARESLVRTASAYLGVQYRWGGKTHMGIDCSGLCSMAYLQNGYTIYRDADILEGMDMREISREELKRGDLIFITGHVTMYLGGGEYIHATARCDAPCVTVNSLCPDSALYNEYCATHIIKYGSVFA